jgi:hypothetical protein
MFKPDTDKSVSCRLFETLLNIWRTFYELFINIKEVHNTVTKKLDDFVTTKLSRHKSYTPDMGSLMVLASCSFNNDKLFKTISHQTQLMSPLYLSYVISISIRYLKFRSLQQF